MQNILIKWGTGVILAYSQLTYADLVYESPKVINEDYAAHINATISYSFFNGPSSICEGWQKAIQHNETNPVMSGLKKDDKEICWRLNGSLIEMRKNWTFWDESFFILKPDSLPKQIIADPTSYCKNTTPIPKKLDPSFNNYTDPTGFNLGLCDRQKKDLNLKIRASCDLNIKKKMNNYTYDKIKGRFFGDKINSITYSNFHSELNQSKEYYSFSAIASVTDTHWDKSHRVVLDDRKTINVICVLDNNYDFSRLSTIP
jgi:hypothetical protein